MRHDTGNMSYSAYLKANSVSIVAGLLILASGSATLGWMAQQPIFALGIAGMRPIALITAVLFILSAGALIFTRNHLVNPQRKTQKRLAQACATLILLITVPLLFQTVFDVARPTLGLFSNNAAEYGIASPGTLMGLLFAGLAFLLLNSRTYKNKEAILQILVIGTVASGLLGVFGQFSKWMVNVFNISFASALVISLLGVGIYRLASTSGWLVHASIKREDSRISLIGGLILLGMGLSISLLVVGLFYNHFEQMLINNLSNRLAGDVNRFQDNLDHKVTSLSALSLGRLAPFHKTFGEGMTLVEETSVETALETLVSSSEISAITLYDRSGRVLGQKGEFAPASELNIPLNLRYPAWLLWQGQLVLRLQIPILEGNKPLGSYVVDAPLPMMTKLLYNTQYLGESAEPAICGPYGEAMQCAPTRVTGRVIKRPRHIQNRPLPMFYALRGESGVIATQDYRNVPVVAAYGPIGKSNLGMVVKVDAEELYRPERARAQKIVPIFLGLLFLGFTLLRWQVVPLVRRLGDAELHNRLMIENMLDALITTDKNGTITLINPAAEKMFGYQSGEILGRDIKILLPDYLHASWDRDLQLYFKTGEGRLLGKGSQEITAQCKDGSLIPVEISVSQVVIEGAVYFLGMMRDISERKRQTKELELAGQVIQNTNAGVLIADKDKTVQSINAAFTEILGYTPHEILGHSLKLIQKSVTEESTRQKLKEMWAILEKTGEWQGEIEGRRRDGGRYAVTLNMNESRDEFNVLTHYVGVFTDIQERKKSEERIFHLAHYDALTGLPNRLSFYDKLQEAIVYGQRNNLPFAILFLDIDRFKDINDTSGHGVGDLVLRMVAQRLLRCVRSSDVVSRLGGDEFTIMLMNLGHVEGATIVAEKILHALTQKATIGDQDVFVSASIGITLFPSDGGDPQKLIKNADIAMYRAKELGRNNFQFYTTEINAQIVERLELQNRLYRALDHQQFELYYQPQIDTTTQTIVGVEALIRWNHPEIGMISPAQFIPLAEDKGLIVPIGEWVLATACEQVAEWRNSGFPLKLAVNLSARQFRQANLAEEISKILSAAGLVAGDLELELTESYIMENPEEAIKILRKLKGMGVQLSVDDFGTGYSSLSYLKRFPIDTLKIDQSFVREVASDADNAAIVTAIIAMATSLKLQVVAEGVETEEQRQFLSSRGCTKMQGYFFSRPLTPENLSLLLGTQRIASEV